MKQRVCNQCGKDFEQTFGGRPRKKCYDCVPARLNQKAGGQSHDLPRTKRGTPQHRSVQRQAQQPRPESTVGKHTGNSAKAVVSDGVHCGWCGSYVVRGRYCNERHEEAAIARMQSGYKLPTDKRRVRIHVRTQRPLERVRELHEAERRPSRKKAPA